MCVSSFDWIVFTFGINFWMIHIFCILIVCELSTGNGFLSFSWLLLQSLLLLLLFSNILVWYIPICQFLVLFHEHLYSYSGNLCLSPKFEVLSSYFPLVVSKYGTMDQQPLNTWELLLSFEMLFLLFSKFSCIHIIGSKNCDFNF